MPRRARPRSGRRADRAAGGPSSAASSRRATAGEPSSIAARATISWARRASSLPAGRRRGSRRRVGPSAAPTGPRHRPRSTPPPPGRRRERRTRSTSLSGERSLGLAREAPCAGRVAGQQRQSDRFQTAARGRPGPSASRLACGLAQRLQRLVAQVRCRGGLRSQQRRARPRSAARHRVRRWRRAAPDTRAGRPAMSALRASSMLGRERRRRRAEAREQVTRADEIPLGRDRLARVPRATPPRLRSNCASQKASPRSRSVASAASVPASGSVVVPAYQSTADPEDLGAGLFVRRPAPRSASSSSRNAAVIAPRPARSSARRRRASAVRRVKTMTLTAADGAADRPDRSPVAQFVLGEAERVQRRDLGLRMSSPAGKPERALGHAGRRGRVRLDQVEGGLRRAPARRPHGP